MAVVAWPPPTPPNTRANATVQLDNHALDHNRAADALDTIIARINALPKGRMAWAQSTSNASGITTAPVDVVSVTFTAEAGRRYKVSGSAVWVTAAGANAVQVILTDGANAVLNAIAFTMAISGYASGGPTIEIPPGAAGSRTYKLRISTNQSTLSLNGAVGQMHWIMVEDVGV